MNLIQKFKTYQGTAKFTNGPLRGLELPIDYPHPKFVVQETVAGEFVIYHRHRYRIIEPKMYIYTYRLPFA